MAKANGMTKAILEALDEGPGTILEIAIDTGFPRRSVAARMSELRKCGRVYSRGRVPTRTKPASIWEVK